jgi:peptidoglycan/LPS O-acetylase OafA/YrhL
MTIYREGSEIRVERSEKRAWTIGLLMLGGGAFLAAYSAPHADRTTDWLLVAGMFLFGVLLLIANLRRRNVCIIRSEEIEYVFIGGPMFSIR